MPYLVIVYDHLDKQGDKKPHRDAHHAYLAAQGTRLLSSGALLDESGTQTIGGVALLDTDEREDAVRFEAEDPGIRQSVEIIPWRLNWWLGNFERQGHHPSQKQA